MASKDAINWVVAHCWNPPGDWLPDYEPEAPSPDVLCHSLEELRATLWSKAAGDPYSYHLRQMPSDIGYISLMLGGDWGMVSRLWRHDNCQSYRNAFSESETGSPKVLFMDGREGSLQEAGSLLPVADIIDATIYICEHGDFLPRLCWRGWDSLCASDAS